MADNDTIETESELVVGSTVSKPSHIVVYYDVSTGNLYNAKGSLFGNNTFSTFLNNSFILEIHYVKDTALSNNPEDWVVWDGLKNKTVSSTLAFDNNYIHAVEGKVLSDVNSGSTNISVLISGVNKNELDVSGNLVLNPFGLSSEKKVISYQSFTTDITGSTFTFNLESALTTNVLRETSVRVEDPLYLNVDADTIYEANIPPRYDEGVFEIPIYVMSRKLLSALDYTGVASLEGTLEHNIYTKSDTVSGILVSGSTTALIRDKQYDTLAIDASDEETYLFCYWTDLENSYWTKGNDVEEGAEVYLISGGTATVQTEGNEPVIAQPIFDTDSVLFRTFSFPFIVNNLLSYGTDFKFPVENTDWAKEYIISLIRNGISGTDGNITGYVFSNEFNTVIQNTSNSFITINSIIPSKVVGLVDALNGKQDVLQPGAGISIMGGFINVVSAPFATNASSATTAGYATTAGNATFATTAENATSAVNATSASNAAVASSLVSSYVVSSALNAAVASSLTSDYVVSSAYNADIASSLVSSYVVSSASNATKASYASGLVSGYIVRSAYSAGLASSADYLTDSAAAYIITSSGLLLGGSNAYVSSNSAYALLKNLNINPGGVIVLGAIEQENSSFYEFCVPSVQALKNYLGGVTLPRASTAIEAESLPASVYSAITSDIVGSALDSLQSGGTVYCASSLASNYVVSSASSASYAVEARLAQIITPAGTSNNPVYSLTDLSDTTKFTSVTNILMSNGIGYRNTPFGAAVIVDTLKTSETALNSIAVPTGGAVIDYVMSVVSTFNGGTGGTIDSNTVVVSASTATYALSLASSYVVESANIANTASALPSAVYSSIVSDITSKVTSSIQSGGTAYYASAAGTASALTSAAKSSIIAEAIAAGAGASGGTGGIIIYSGGTADYASAAGTASSAGFASSAGGLTSNALAFVIEPTVSGTVDIFTVDYQSDGNAFEYLYENGCFGGVAMVKSIQPGGNGDGHSYADLNQYTVPTVAAVYSHCLYNGPFAVHNDEGPLVNISTGAVVIGGSRYTVSASSATVSSGYRLWLVGSSGASSATFAYSAVVSGSSPVLSSSGMFAHCICGRHGLGEADVQQYQYGDIITVPWGVTASGVGGYNGPFAVGVTSAGITVAGGRMYLGGAEYAVGSTTLTSSNGTVYYYVYYSSGSYYSGCSVAASASALASAIRGSAGFYTALAYVSGGSVTQYHYGDIRIDGRVV